MEFKKENSLEISLGIVLILLLITIIILVFTILSSSNINSKATAQAITITNSFNTNYYNQNENKISYYKNKFQNNDISFKHRGKYEEVIGLFGNEIDRYIVYVKNAEKSGEYFRVKFYFKDYYGDEATESITKYIAPDKEEKFVYQDIYSDKYKHNIWRYEVIPI